MTAAEAVEAPIEKITTPRAFMFEHGSLLVWEDI
jgi:hypothetical protein